MSLFSPISPRAAEPKRIILSGCAASTTLWTISAKAFLFGRPSFRLRCLVFIPRTRQAIPITPRGSYPADYPRNKARITCSMPLLQSGFPAGKRGFGEGPMRGQCVAKPRPIETVLVTGPLRGGTTIAARNFAIALSLPLKCSATARGPSLFRNIHHQDPKAQFSNPSRPKSHALRGYAGQLGPRAGAVKSWACTGLTLIRFPLMTAPDVRRGSHDPAGVPDRRSPSPGVSFSEKGICAHGVRSEGRRPSVRHLCGVMRPAHNELLHSKSLSERHLHVGRGSSDA